MYDTVKVLFLESQSNLPSDSQVHALLMRHFDPDSVQVHVACTPGTVGSSSTSINAFESMPGVHVFRTEFGARATGQAAVHRAKSAFHALRSVLELASYVRRNRIDVIHAASRPRDAVMAVLVAKLAGAKSVIHLHVMVSDWFGRPMRWSLRQCDGILCISNFVKMSVLEAGYGPDKTHCVLNGLAVGEWDPSTDGTAIRREFEICPDTPLFAIVSRLFSWKGHTELFKALALVHREIPRFKLLVVGEDDPLAHPGGGRYSEELKALAAELCLTDNIVFTGFRKDIKTILSACDVYTMPSFEEPLGVAFLEAMAMQKPVIALASGGVPEVVEHGVTGLLSEPGDIDGLAANILTLLRDPELRCRMGHWGREHVQHRHDPVQLAHQTAQIYRRTANRDP